MVGPWAAWGETSRIKFQHLGVEHKACSSLSRPTAFPSPFSLPHCAPAMQMSLDFPQHTVSFLTTVPLHVCSLWTRICFSLCLRQTLIHLSKVSSEITSFTKFSSIALLISLMTILFGIPPHVFSKPQPASPPMSAPLSQRFSTLTAYRSHLGKFS